MVWGVTGDRAHTNSARAFKACGSCPIDPDTSPKPGGASAVPMPVDRSNTVTKSLAHQRLTRHQRLGFSDER